MNTPLQSTHDPGEPGCCRCCCCRALRNCFRVLLNFFRWLFCCICCCTCARRTKKVQILDSIQTNASAKFARTLKNMLDDFDCLIQNTANIEYEFPLIVVCLKSTRLKPDIELALANVSYPAKCVVLIVHTGAESNLPAISSSTQLSGFPGNIEFIDMGFDVDSGGIYRCQQNDRALELLRKYINQFG